MYKVRGCKIKSMTENNGIEKSCACSLVGLQEPYKYCRECFTKKIDEFRASGPCSSQKYNGKIDWGVVEHLKRVEYMGCGVHKWLYNKALNGCQDSLFKLDFGYILYDEVLAKAKEEGLL